MKVGYFIVFEVFALVAGQDLLQLFSNVVNYRTDFSIDEVLKTFIRGSQLTVDLLLKGDLKDIAVDDDVTFWCRHR